MGKIKIKSKPNDSAMNNLQHHNKPNINDEPILIISRQPS